MATTQNTFTGNGSTTNYSFTFPYLEESDVKVSLDGVDQATTEYSFANATTISFNTAPGNNVAIRIYRETDTDEARTTFFAGSAIRAQDLNDNNNQLLYSTQETINRRVDKTGGTMTGDLVLNDADLVFEGATDDAFETTLTVVDPTADRTITLPNVTGTVVTTGDTGTVATAMIAADAVNGTKIADDSIDSEHYVAGSIDLEHMSANSVDSDQYVDGSIDRVHLSADIIDGTKLADNAVDSEHYTDGSIDRVHLAADIVDGTKIADDSIDSEHYVDGSIDTAHIGNLQVTNAKLAADAVTNAKIADDSIDSEHYVDGSIDTAHIADLQVTTAKLAADSVTNAKIADDSIDSEHYVDGSIDTAHIGNLQVSRAKIAADAIDGTKLADNAVDSEHYTDGSIDTAHIGDSQVTTAKIADSAVTVAKIADAELVELSTMGGLTAAALADLTQAEVQILDGATVTTAELNKIDGLTADATDLNQLDTNTLTNSPTWTSTSQYPSAASIDSRITARIDPLGGFEAIADEDSFPATAPPEGTVVSIANANGLAVNASGVGAGTRAGGSDAVVINGFPSGFNSTSLDDGIGLLVVATSTAHTYDFHRVVAKDEDVRQLSSDINDFKARYRVGSSNPTTDLDSGDLFFNTSTGKMLVYDGTSAAWEEVQSIGEFFINTLSSSSGTGGGSATFNGTAYRFTLSNAPTFAQQLLVSINGVVQKPNSGTTQPSEGFAIDGSDIIFGAAPASGSDFFIVTIGSSVNIGTPSAGTVDTTQLADGAVTNAKVDASAAIAGTKIDADFGAQDLTVDTNVLYVDATNDRVGIGTTPVNAFLEVKNASFGNIAQFRSIAGTANPFLNIVTSSDGITLQEDGSTYGSLIFNTGNTERARIDQSGRLLVGTTSSSVAGIAVFQGYPGGTSNQGIVYVQTGATNPTANAHLANLKFSDAAGSVGAQILAKADSAWASNDYPGRLEFYTTADGASSPTERMRIDSSGRLGIGTTSPFDTLHVGGTGDTGIRLGTQGGTGRARIFVDSGNDFGLRVDTQNVSNALFVDRTSGNVGIGTTSPSEALHVVGKIAVSGTNPSIKQVNQTANLDLCGGTTVGTDSSIQLYASSSSSDANHTFYNSNVQIWRNAAGTTQYGRFDSSGRLLVGTSSATSSFKYGSSGDFSTKSQIDGASSSRDVGLALVNHHSSDTQPILRLAKSRGTAASPTVVSDNDYTGSIQFMGYDGTRYIDTARIDSIVLGNTGSNDMPGGLIFSTTADGASVVTERMRIRDDGDTAVFTSRTDGTCIQADSSGSANNTAITFAGKHSATGTHSGTISFKVTTNGNVTNTNNSYGSLSDIKLKENIVDAGSQWDDLKAIQVRNYNFKEETGHQTHTQLGVIAQEVELVSPGLVTETPDRDDANNDLGTTTKSVNYSVLYMKAVKALQEAMERIETLETANASLEARLTALEGGN